ncbi:MAG: nuclear transport factor 2 family protein [Bacteroidaceae bacterium]|nr:nuclear transport factor 2 family protein [Bacteroidaceae bacterium]
MDDRQKIEELYRRMYRAMVAKDTATLAAIHADEFVLVHMTGLCQPREAYLSAIADGTLNYYSAEHQSVSVTMQGDRATLTGRSRVQAAVFGGGRHVWPLQLRLQLVRRNGQWLFTEARASTY